MYERMEERRSTTTSNISMVTSNLSVASETTIQLVTLLSSPDPRTQGFFSTCAVISAVLLFEILMPGRSLYQARQCNPRRA
ncbi:unnamed protein product [Cyprideis torosa]|uniref:Uncharacterized protein n=1 Tax=Cyprideis torosa TaxID=163714 RepID=A0A7R8W147_9CRUS|nr:unnamed protein product [Cyprideis torosa]CAG0880465.1 unnamed protein product [Cyprideis torosa]